MIQRTGMLRLSGRIRARYLRGVIYTVGHSTRSLEALVALLTAYRVGLVVDVRRYPASRRHPHFAEHPLAAALQAAGIGYRHDPDLGGRRRARRDSPHTAWRSAAFRGYADHMETPAFEQAVARVIALADAQPVAVMGAGEPRDHRLSPYAQVLAEGRLRYPGQPDRRRCVERHALPRHRTSHPK